MITPILAAALAVIATCDLEAPSGAPGCTRAAVDGLKLNQIQAIGTHNSYKQAIAPAEMAMVRAVQPKLADTLDYSKPPLTDQLNDGARQLEIDILNDPGPGGLYADPLIHKMGKDPAPFDFSPLRGPGLKVMHVPDVDYRASCSRLTDCLGEIRAWSKAHPDHIPLLILLNIKDGGLKGVPGTVVAPVFDAAAMDEIDAEIGKVFERPEIITPDLVQGRHATLREGAAAGGWPPLKAARGKVMFVMDSNEKDAATYRGSRKSLEGRLLFVNTAETSPAAGYITLNEPDELAGRIKAALAAGLIVRTRADSDTAEARTDDKTRQAAAFASGAQYVSTDYMRPDPRFSAYEAHLPGGGKARLNPVTGLADETSTGSGAR
jgi:hypothetical protein